MTLSNHLDPIQETGFTRQMGLCDARRQLQVSTAVVAILSIVAAAVIATPGLLHGAYNPTQIELKVHAPQLIHAQQALAVNWPASVTLPTTKM
jgi:hypothetical protein